eukprot:4977562-Karenia_brevis.AAC.1
MGEQWSQRHSDECKKSGRPQPHYVKMDPPLEVGGAGSGTQVATDRVQLIQLLRFQVAVFLRCWDNDP